MLHCVVCYIVLAIFQIFRDSTLPTSLKPFYLFSSFLPVSIPFTDFQPFYRFPTNLPVSISFTGFQLIYRFPFQLPVSKPSTGFQLIYWFPPPLLFRTTSLLGTVQRDIPLFPFQTKSPVPMITIIVVVAVATKWTLRTRSERQLIRNFLIAFLKQKSWQRSGRQKIITTL